LKIPNAVNFSELKPQTSKNKILFVHLSKKKFHKIQRDNFFPETQFQQKITTEVIPYLAIISSINTTHSNASSLSNELPLKSHKNIESILSDNCLLSGQQTNLIERDSG
jgi:hypothetical protein